jgi:hypothetical protein
MIRYINTNLEIIVKIDDGDETLHPQAKIYDSSDALLDTITLAHVSSGIYIGVWAGSATAGEYYADYIVYTDAGHTVQSTDCNEMCEDIFLIESDEKIDDLQTDITFIKDVEGGKWIRDGTQLKMYKSDNMTLVATFDLKKNDGTDAGENDDVFQRDRA